MTVLGRLRGIPSWRLIRRARTRRSRQPRSACAALRLLCPIGPLPVRSDCRGDHARAAARALDELYGATWPKATAKITGDVEELLACYDYPAGHWIHLRTTSPIESTFATVRHQAKVPKGPGSEAAGIAMAFKLIEAAQERWRAVSAPHLVALVRAGTRFECGKLVDRDPVPEATQAAGDTPAQPPAASNQPVSNAA